MGWRAPVHLFARRDVLNGHHVWCEYRFRQELMISNTLYERFRFLGVTGFGVRAFFGDA